MSFTDIIFSRRSIRQYTDERVSEEKIKQLLKAGMCAPSAKNAQPWHFMVIEARETLDMLPDICPYGTMLRGAPLAILVMGDLDISNDYSSVDCSAAVENILLAAEAEGLGACWVGVYPRPERIKKLKKLFHLPESIQPHSLIAVGKPAESKPPNDRYLEERVHRERW